MPYAGRREIIKPQFLYLNVLNVVIGLFIYFNPQLFTNSLLAIFKKSYLFKAYLLFIALAGVSIFVAKNVSLSLNALAEIVVVFIMFVNFAVLLHNRLHLLYKIAFIVGACAFVQSISVLNELRDFIFGNKSLEHVLESMKGNTGNINILSASVMTKVPFLFIGITYFSGWKRWLLVVSLWLAASVIFFLNARSALLSMIGIIAAFSILYFRIYTLTKPTAIKAAYFFSPILIAAIAVNVFLSVAIENDNRFSGTVSRLKQINIGEGSASTRLHFWSIAAHFIKEHPVSGIGLGNWRIESIPYETRKDKIVSLNTHNDFLEIAAETGIINGLVYCSIFAALLVINFKRLARIRERQDGLLIILPSLLLIVYGVDAFFNFPLYRPTIQLSFCFLMSITMVQSHKIDQKAPKAIYPKMIGLLVLTAAVPLYVTYYADRTSELEFRINADNIDFNAGGKVTGDEIVSQRALFPNVFNTSETFEEYAGIYYLREKKYDLAIQHLDRGKSINPHLGRQDFYKYLVASELGNQDSAYYYVKSSFYTYPATSTLTSAIAIAQNYADTTEILKIYRFALKFQKSPNAWKRTVLALQSSDYRRAGIDRILEEGIENFPGDTTVRQVYNATKITGHIISGQALFAAGKQLEALQVYQQALKIDPTNVYIQQNLGFYYFNMGRNKEAIPYLLKALEKPGLFDGKTEYYLGICYVNINQAAKACSYFRTALARNYVDAKNALSQFCK